MGLDMYLEARMGLYPCFGEKQAQKITELTKIFPEIEENCEFAGVTFRVGYWRKANHIHKWFVDNVQDGEDNCEEYYVSRDRLIALFGLCKQAIEKRDNAANVLPTQSGFFFGGTEYDDCYFHDLERTIEIIEKCLKLPDDWRFCYHSSW
jgi:hypothetical protein